MGTKRIIRAVLTCAFAIGMLVAFTSLARAALSSSVAANFEGATLATGSTTSGAAVQYCGGTGQSSCSGNFAPIQVSWGTSDRSALGFVPEAGVIDLNSNDARFTVGDVNHQNRVVGLDEAIASGKFRLTVTVIDDVRGVQLVASDVAPFRLDETLNVQASCPYGSTNGLCNDRVVLEEPYLEDTIDDGNVRYILDGFRFDDAYMSGDSGLVMVTPENGNRTRSASVRVRRVDLVVAEAGPNRTVDEATTVQLDGTDSQVEDLTYEWVQTSGPPVSLSGANTATPTFVAPELSESSSVTFRLTVRDRIEPNTLVDSDEVTIFITDINDPPVARDDGPYEVNEGSAVTLDGSASTDPDGQPLTYSWDFGVNGSIDATGPTPVFDAALLDGPVTVPVRLTVCDTFTVPVCDEVDTYVDVLNVAPSALVSSPNVTDEGSAITINVSATDPSPADELVLTHAWDLDGDGVFGDQVGSAATITPGDGPTTIPVAVETCDDDEGCVIATGIVEVLNVAPTPDIGPDLTVYRNDVVNLTAPFSDPAGSFDDVYEVVWSGDAPFVTTTSGVNYGSDPTLSTVYPIEGDYAVEVAVTDKDGGVGTDGLIVTVLNKPPICTGAFPSTAELWPPNHKFVAISVEGLTDPEGDELVTQITSIFQDEPVVTNGSGSPNSVDGRGIGTSTAEVKAERAGPQDSRFYHISFLVDDGHGGQCEGTVQVVVPHDRGRNAVYIDGGPLYDSTVLN